MIHFLGCESKLKQDISKRHSKWPSPVYTELTWETEGMQETEPSYLFLRNESEQLPRQKSSVQVLEKTKNRYQVTWQSHLWAWRPRKTILRKVTCIPKFTAAPWAKQATKAPWTDAGGRRCGHVVPWDRTQPGK